MSIIERYATESYVQDYAQPKGNYATEESVNQLSEQIADQQTEIDGKQPKGNYLLSVPSEYVTETELNNKGYALKNSLTLGKGSDGLIYLFVNGSPQGSGLEVKSSDVVTGDVVGFMDENNNIYLTGAVPTGEYNLWFEDENGKHSFISSWTHDANAPNYTNLMNVYEVIRDKRFSSSNGSPWTKDCLGMVTVKIPFSAMMNKTLRIKAPNIAKKTADNRETNFNTISGSNTFAGYTFYNGDGGLSYVPCAVNEGNNTYSFLFNDANVDCPFSSSSTMYACIVANTTGTAVTDEELAQIIITIDEPIV